MRRVWIALALTCLIIGVVYAANYYPAHKVKSIDLSDYGGSTTDTIDQAYIATIANIGSTETIAALWTFSTQPHMNAGVGFASGAETITWDGPNTWFQISDAVSVEKITTGIIETEVYGMDQHVRTTDDVTFDEATLTGLLRVDDLTLNGQILSSGSGSVIVSPAVTAGSFDIYLDGVEISTWDVGSDDIIFNSLGNAVTSFVVESDTDANLIWTDPVGAGEVGIGTNAPEAKLHVYSGTAGTVTPYVKADNLVVEADTTGGISIITPDGVGTAGNLVFGTPGDSDGGRIESYFTDGEGDPEDDFVIMSLFAAGKHWIRFRGQAAPSNYGERGAVIVNENGYDFDFRVESENLINMMNINAGNDTVGINTATPGGFFDIQNDDDDQATLVLGADVDGTTYDPESKIYQEHIQTAAGTTPSTIWTLVTAADSNYQISARIMGYDATQDTSSAFWINCLYENDGGVMSKVGETVQDSFVQGGVGTPAFGNSGTNIILQVTGVAGYDVEWNAQIEVMTMP